MTAREEKSPCIRSLVLRNDLSELHQLATFARAIGRDEGLDQNQIFALELCLEEAATNVIMHGRSGGYAGEHIWVTVTNDGSSVVACLEDDGSPFDPTRVPTPSVPASLEDAPVGGLGVHLIRKFASKMRYQRIDGRNRITLEFGPLVRGRIELK